MPPTRQLEEDLIHQVNAQKNIIQKNLSLDVPILPPIPAYCCECRVLKRAHRTRLDGQIMDGGETRNLFMTPPMEKPMRLSLACSEKKRGDRLLTA